MPNKGNFRHGDARDDAPAAEYNTWHKIRSRTTNPNDKGWNRYGGRGIKVCERWFNSYQSFLEDMGRRPSSKHSIERINNDGNYEPSNCKWALPIEQHNNTCANRRIAHNGKFQTIGQWAREYGLDRHLLRARLQIGWPMEKALTQPLKKRLPHASGSVGAQQSVLYQIPPSLPLSAGAGFQFQFTTFSGHNCNAGDVVLSRYPVTTKPQAWVQSLERELSWGVPLEIV